MYQILNNTDFIYKKVLIFGALLLGVPKDLVLGGSLIMLFYVGLDCHLLYTFNFRFIIILAAIIFYINTVLIFVYRVVSITHVILYISFKLYYYNRFFIFSSYK